MPGYKGHLTGAIILYGILALFAAYSNFYFPDAIQGLFFICLGALFPDVDTKSKGQKLFYLFLGIALIVSLLRGYYSSLVVMTTFAFLPLIVSHRGLFHKLWFLTVLTVAIVWLLAESFPGNRISIFFNGLLFFLGIISHLVLDFGIVRMFKR